jgi:cytochrome c-type biogenesis protein CcmE
MKKSSIILIVTAAVLLGVIMSMIGDFSQDATFKTASNKPGKSFQIVGSLDTSLPMIYDEKVNTDFFSFHIKDKAGQVQLVEFKGPKPTDFERSESITLTGSMQGEVFSCSKILTKCPSKYNNDKAFMAKS